MSDDRMRGIGLVGLSLVVGTATVEIVFALQVDNPLIPAAYDIVWSVIALALIALVVTALASVWRSRASLTATQEAVWYLLVLFVPLLGSIAWFAAGRPATQRV